MLLFLTATAFILVLVYFLRQRRDDAWQRFRQRRAERKTRSIPDQPSDPNFQFDKPVPSDFNPGGTGGKP